jgi:hypothetical protein
VAEDAACERAVDAQAVAEDADGDHLELGRLRKHLLVAVLVEQDGVVHLLLVLALRPLPVKGVGHSSQRAAARDAFTSTAARRSSAFRGVTHALLLLLASAGLLLQRG